MTTVHNLIELTNHKLKPVAGLGMVTTDLFHKRQKVKSEDDFTLEGIYAYKEGSKVMISVLTSMNVH